MPGEDKERRSEYLSDEILAIRDPIGEVRHVAEELWREAGSREGETFRDYWATAEEMLLSGRGSSIGLGVLRRAHSEPELASGITTLIEGADPFISVFASAFRGYLNDYESLCFTRLCEANQIVLHSGDVLGPLGVTEIASILAVLANEYDRRFLAQFGGDTIAAPIDARVNYWIARITEVERRDDPLNYAQQNTIRRLISQLAAESRVREVRFTDD